MLNLELYFGKLITANDDLPRSNLHSIGGLFLEESAPASFVSLISHPSEATVSWSSKRSCRRKLISLRRRRGGFLSVTLSSIKDGELSVNGVSGNVGEKNRDAENESENETILFKEVVKEEKREVLRGGGGSTLNTAKHLWAGAAAAMVSRFSANRDSGPCLFMPVTMQPGYNSATPNQIHCPAPFPCLQC